VTRGAAGRIANPGGTAASVEWPAPSVDADSGRAVQNDVSGSTGVLATAGSGAGVVTTGVLISGVVVAVEILLAGAGAGGLATGGLLTGGLMTVGLVTGGLATD
jgi:hypothetical protein